MSNDAMIQRLQPLLDLLDNGLALYRRHFFSFVMLSALAIVPLALMITLIFISISRSWWSASEGSALLFLFAVIFALFLLAIYMVGWLSRAAAAALDDRPLQLREVLMLRPGRATLMGCFSVVYLFVVQLLSSLVSVFVICPIYLLLGMIIIAVSDNNPTSSLTTFLGMVMILVFILLYGFGFLISNAIYSSLIYALQPWIHETRPFGELIQRSLDLVTYRFWRNLFVWILAGMLVAALGITVLFTVGILLSLPLSFVLDTSSITYTAISVCMWLLGFIVILPPLPIWMTLLYRKNIQSREGSDLEEMLDEWWYEHFEVKPSTNTL